MRTGLDNALLSLRHVLCMDCLDFSMNMVSVVGWREGSSAQSSGSRSLMCCKLPTLSSRRETLANPPSTESECG